MNKVKATILAAFFAVFTMSATAAYASADCSKETGLDKAWDQVTTMGKSGTDKDAAIMKNKAERVQRCAEKMAKKAQKEAEKTAGDMKKKLGL